MVTSNAATGYVAKIMLGLNIGRGTKAVQGKGGERPPLAFFAFGSEANAEHARTELA